mmetsp:Transcript_95461/g.248900  ORF Transcript_95461/g.248900 Transcript_95461/m.248900 type:complete len:205 (+) Transcript_95461:210-824(+)
MFTLCTAMRYAEKRTKIPRKKVQTNKFIACTAHVLSSAMLTQSDSAFRVSGGIFWTCLRICASCSGDSFFLATGRYSPSASAAASSSSSAASAFGRVTTAVEDAESPSPAEAAAGSSPSAASFPPAPCSLGRVAWLDLAAVFGPLAAARGSAALSSSSSSRKNFGIGPSTAPLATKAMAPTMPAPAARSGMSASPASNAANAIA